MATNPSAGTGTGNSLELEERSPRLLRASMAHPCISPVLQQQVQVAAAPNLVRKVSMVDDGVATQRLDDVPWSDITGVATKHRWFLGAAVAAKSKQTTRVSHAAGHVITQTTQTTHSQSRRHTCPTRVSLCMMRLMNISALSVGL